MNPNSPSLILATLLCAAFSVSNAQIKTKIFSRGIPDGRIAARSVRTTTKVIPAPPEFAGYLKSSNPETPLQFGNRFATPQSVDLDVPAIASRIEESGFATYSLNVEAESALNLSVRFKEFYLPERAILSIYTKYELTDSITSTQNNPNRIWATRVYQGNRLTISLKVPIAKKDSIVLKIDQVNFGFKAFGGQFFGNPGASLPCNINVACPEAAGWENERNSVALIVINGDASCSGSLVMNTCNTRKPFFLTAYHCLGGNVSNWVFQFQTWSSSCDTNTGWQEDIQFNGATLRASNAITDFLLLELNQQPQSGSGITYSGWNRGSAVPNGSVGLHHPAGDLMKFSRDFDPSGLTTWINPNTHWVAVFEQGTLEPGSSGSPLYDMNHRVVGQLTADQNDQGDYCNQRRGEYGRFDLSWTGGGTNTTRLSNWLDPNNSGAMTTNTTNVATLTPTSFSISGPPVFCSQSYYSITDLPAGATVTWSTSGGLVISGSNTASTIAVSGNGDGVGVINATITTSCNTFSLSRSIAFGIPVFPDYTTIPSPVCAGQDATLHFNLASGQSIVSAVVNQGGDLLPMSGSGSYYQLPGDAYGVTLVIQGTCGTAEVSRLIRKANCNTLFSVYPNPANAELTVGIEQLSPNSTKKSTSELPVTGPVQLRLLNRAGIVVRTASLRSAADKATINTSGLTNGIYFLSIQYGQHTETKEILIQH